MLIAVLSVGSCTTVVSKANAHDKFHEVFLLLDFFMPRVMTAFPIISPSLHAPLGLGLRGEQERERRYKSKPAVLGLSGHLFRLAPSGFVAPKLEAVLRPVRIRLV